MSEKIKRREFLLLCATGLGSLAFRPLFMRGGDSFEAGNLARVAAYSISVYSQPNDKSRIVRQLYRDELVNVYYEVNSEYGPAWNPLWYRVWGGYIHSAHTEKVQVRLNSVLNAIPKEGQLAEVTVPYTQSLRRGYTKKWDSRDCYRLYYGSMHWITGIEEGPDQQPWYRLKDELLEVEYIVPAIHLRPVKPEEFAPISPDVPPEEKHIEVSLSRQTLTAYEGTDVVLHTKISSGIPSHLPSPTGIPTATPKGDFRVYSKMPSKHMGDGNLTGDIEAYELPGVPWVSFFADNGVALHGTYWHNNFGVQMSHGCVNMRTNEANWIFRWTTPVTDAGIWEKRGRGTQVKVG
ncbi:MAG TPA: L,D-transpeptidase family protein [Anaerolineaceae bacterium]|nr:L,D-transpeptidase family protein [Anaerolineaceae bacterium]